MPFAPASHPAVRWISLAHDMRERWQRLQNFFDEICTLDEDNKGRLAIPVKPSALQNPPARSWLLLWMVIRKRRPLILLRWILAQLLHQNSDGLFKLRIVTLAHRLRILLHLDIGRDAEIFNFP
jgi:hypothetical protein